MPALEKVARKCLECLVTVTIQYYTVLQCNTKGAED